MIKTKTPESGITFQVAEVELNEVPCPSTFTPPNLRMRAEAYSYLGQRFVQCSHNPILAAAALAHNRHYPLALCPDAIWLTISSGLSQHIDRNPEELRELLVSHSGCLEIEVEDNGNWIESIEELASRLKAHVNPEVSEFFTPTFSTTGPDAKLAQSMIFLNAHKNYFHYAVDRPICGIPAVTLLGTTSDWQQIADRLELLPTFGLEIWARALRPIMSHFVRASQGDIDRDFWNGLYKEARKGNYQRMCGGPDVEPAHVTGWISLFFPYVHGYLNAQLFAGEPGSEVPDSIEKRKARFAQYHTGSMKSFQSWYDSLNSFDQEYWDDHLHLRWNRLAAFPEGLQETGVRRGRQGYLLAGGLLGVVQDYVSMTVRPLPGWAVGPRPDAQGGARRVIERFHLHKDSISVRSQVVYHSFSTSNKLVSLANDGKNLVAVGPNGMIMTSHDRREWEEALFEDERDFRQVIFSESRFVAVGHGGLVAVSREGREWTTLETVGLEEDIESYAWGNNTHIAICKNGKAFRSTDLKIWNLALQMDAPLQEVRFYGDKFYLLGAGILLESMDGRKWKRAQRGGLLESHLLKSSGDSSLLHFVPPRHSTEITLDTFEPRLFAFRQPPRTDPATVSGFGSFSSMIVVETTLDEEFKCWASDGKNTEIVVAESGNVFRKTPDLEEWAPCHRVDGPWEDIKFLDGLFCIPAGETVHQSVDGLKWVEV